LRSAPSRLSSSIVPFGLAALPNDERRSPRRCRQCRSGRDNGGRDAKQNYAEEQADHD
jgi:hypothetical protein